MADVRGASGVPLAAAFGGVRMIAPSTPIYIDTATGSAYVLVSGAVVQLASPLSVSTGLTAAGTTQGTALALTAGINTVTTTASGTGVVLSSSLTEQRVYNAGTNPLKVYPPTGAKINQLATNAAISLAINTAVAFWKATSTQWIGSLSA